MPTASDTDTVAKCNLSAPTRSTSESRSAPLKPRANGKANRCWPYTRNNDKKVLSVM
jgi:hypothetical protein